MTGMPGMGGFKRPTARVALRRDCLHWARDSDADQRDTECQNRLDLMSHQRLRDARLLRLWPYGVVGRDVIDRMRRRG